MLAINPAALGEVGKTNYTAMTTVVYAQQCAELYPTALKSYQVKNYTRAQELLEKIVAMDEKYKDGESLFMLIDIYLSKNESEKATEKFNRLTALFPDTDVARRASEKMAAAKPAESE